MIASVLLSLLAVGSALSAQPGQAPVLFGHSLLFVVSGSMEPTLPKGSILLVKQESITEVAENDIISFYSKDPNLMGNLNTHRVLHISGEANARSLTTKGDANAVADPYTVEESNFLGRVVWHSAALGLFLKFIQQKYVFAAIILLPLLLILIGSVRQFFRLMREQRASIENEAKEMMRQANHEDTKEDEPF